MPLSDRERSHIDELVAGGRYAEAAAAARKAGDPGRAAGLYERIWMFFEAAHAAREAGDLGTAFRHALDARDNELAAEIARSLEEEGPEGQRIALSVLERRRRFADAAPLAERLGERDRAIALYQSAHMDLDAARLLEDAGRVREAGRRLERVLAHSDAPEQRARAQLALGLLLSRRMQHEAAVRHLQEAAKHSATRRQARRALVVELAALDFRDAARDVLLTARRDDPSLPLDVDELVRVEREHLAGGEASSREDAPLVAGRYRLATTLGNGGSGRVYLAQDEVSGRQIAVKLFHSAFARDREAFGRFVREAKVASALRHPNVVDVYHVAPEHGALVMENMAGGSLADRLPSPLSGPAARRMALDVLAGLEAAHRRGIVHRDVKPANIFFDARGSAKLGDFGIAHLLDLGQTQTGGLIGTIAYMAPEQITGADLTIAADLYGLGVTLFEALTGQLPFLGPDFVAQHLGEAPPSPSEVSPQLGDAWDPIVARLLAKSPDARYSDLDELRRDLESLDLGGADEPAPLVLPRQGAASRAASATEAPSPPRRPRRDSAAPDPGAADESYPGRYAYETTFRRSENAVLSRALDTALDRTVVIERYGAEGLDAESEARLLRFGRGGGPYLQRVLTYDRDAGIAVYEAPAGKPLEHVLSGRPLSPRAALRLLQRLARAVAPLHESGSAHGALSAHAILYDEGGYPTVLAAGLGPAPSGAGPRGDVAAILQLVATAVDAGPSIAELARALLPAGPLPELSEPHSGEELYALAESLEIALLRAEPSLTERAGSTRGDQQHDG